MDLCYRSVWKSGEFRGAHLPPASHGGNLLYCLTRHELGTPIAAICMLQRPGPVALQFTSPDALAVPMSWGRSAGCPESSSVHVRAQESKCEGGRAWWQQQ